MPKLLRKALRGAASVGAQGMMMEHASQIRAKRDAVLRQYSLEDQQTAAAASSEAAAGKRAAQVEDREDKQKHAIELEKLKQSGTGSGGAVQGDIQLMEWFLDRGVAENPDEARTMVQQMNTDPTKLIFNAALKMSESETVTSRRKPLSDYVKIVEDELGELKKRMNKKKPTTENFFDQFDALDK